MAVYYEYTPIAEEELGLSGGEAVLIGGAEDYLLLTSFSPIRSVVPPPMTGTRLRAYDPLRLWGPPEVSFAHALPPPKQDGNPHEECLLEGNNRTTLSCISSSSSSSSIIYRTLSGDLERLKAEVMK